MPEVAEPDYTHKVEIKHTSANGADIWEHSFQATSYDDTDTTVEPMGDKVFLSWKDGLAAIYMRPGERIVVNTTETASE